MAADSPILTVTTTVEENKKEERVQVVEDDSPQAILRRLEGYCKNIPTKEEIYAHWAILKEISLKATEGWALEAESRLLLRTHIEDMRVMKELQTSSIKQTENLVTAQDRLATILDNISNNLENGFKLGTSVVKLFGKIVLVFLASLIILSLVIVWIARIDLSYEEGKGSIRRSERAEWRTVDPPPAP